MPSAITCTDLSFSWPDGTPVLDGLSATFGPGRTGLVGVNGAGKSTLLRVIAGALAPAAGTVTVAGPVGYLPQDLTLDTAAPVAALLGVSAALGALRAIEAGSADPDLYDAVGDDWDIEERARGELDRLGLRHVDLADPADRLSGGEVVLTALAALLLRRPPVLLLDEPTNNLDAGARARLYEAVREWPGVLLIVSHDRALLSLVDQVADLSGGRVRMYGGNLDAYEEQLAADQEAAGRAVTAAVAEVRREKRDLAESQVKQARRDRQGRLAAQGMPPILAGARKRRAQETAGRTAGVHGMRLAAAQSKLAAAQDAVRDDAGIRLDLPGTVVPAGRTVLTMTGLAGGGWHPYRNVAPEPAPAPGPGSAPGSPADPAGAAGATAPAGETAPAAADGARPALLLAELIVRGPERIALTGPNGAGKTTLLRMIAGELPTGPGADVRAAVATGYLPQRLAVPDPAATVAHNVRQAAPDASPNEVRAGLARFLFRGSRADQLAGSLSGGERFRAAMAALLLATPPPQLLLLDEPTNNLDLASARQLTSALECYRGALLVVSHDRPFLDSIGISRWLHLDRSGHLTEAPGLPGLTGKINSSAPSRMLAFFGHESLP